MPFDDPIDFGFYAINMPMRGWQSGRDMGKNSFYPMLNCVSHYLQHYLRTIPVLFQGVMGSIFYDIGGVWTDSFKSTYKDLNGTPHPADLLMSAGIGVRTYLL
jgi:outer membrane protein assembly factor BamA